MSRIPFRGAVVASSAVSVVALGLLGGLAPSSSAADKNLYAHSQGARNTSRSNSAVTFRNAEVDAAFGGTAQLPFSEVTGAFPPAVAMLFAPAGTVAAAANTTLGAATAAQQAVAKAKAAAAAAAAKARAAKAAAAQAAARTQVRSSALGAVSGSPRAIAQALAANRGWSGQQWVCLDQLWQHESRFETTAMNRSSGAYGIPQALPASKMASAGSDWRTNPVTQIVWGLGYISDRYGTPCGAWNHWIHAYSY